MSATTPEPDPSEKLSSEPSPKKKGKILNLSAKTLLPSHVINHHPKAGLNPVVDAAGRLISILGKLNACKTYHHLDKLQKELISEMFFFQDALENLNYDPEYVLICQYILCATLDDIISHTAWGNQGAWNSYCLLDFFTSELEQQDVFFTILERTLKDSQLYIDVIELIYICLSMGYKGQYRSNTNGQFQLEQISNNLYKHIRSYRGNFSKTLSPSPLKIKSNFSRKKISRSVFLILIASVCMIMVIFFGLGYLMDAISNEAYQEITTVQKPISNISVKQ